MREKTVAFIIGTNKSEVKTGTTNSDTIKGLGGNDTLYGKSGNDKIWGGTGNDSLHGDAGNDVLRGEDGNDKIYGKAGNDIILGGIENDKLYGDAGIDTVKGEAGNDIIKGGLGVSYLYGGSGNDQLFYDPTRADISTEIGTLSTSLMDGGIGTDTLNVFTKANFTSEGVSKPAYTSIDMVDDNSGWILVGNPNDYFIEAGDFTGIEKITVTGAGGMRFVGAFEGRGMDVTGSKADDLLISYYNSDTLSGGGGNDTFWIGGGNDKVFSGSNDEDIFEFSMLGVGTHSVTGFNGAGEYGGDRIYIEDFYLSDPETAVVKSNGKTIITLDSGYEGLPDMKSVFIIDAVGLIQGVDWFII
jgi:Ca2+-binding RTX toxin-like protein